MLKSKSKEFLAWFLAKTKIALLAARHGHVNKNEKKINIEVVLIGLQTDIVSQYEPCLF